MTLSNLLLVVALVLFIIAALVSGGVVSGVVAATFAYAGLAFFAAAHLPLP